MTGVPEVARSARVDDPTALQRAAAVRHALRVAGQTSALAAMIQGGRPYGDVVQQLLAARGSLDALLVRLLEIELNGNLPRAERALVRALVCPALGRRAPSREGPARRPAPLG